MQELIEIELEKGNMGMARRASLVFSFYVNDFLISLGYTTFKIEPHNWLALRIGEKPLIVICSFRPHLDYIQKLQKFHSAGVVNIAKAYPENYERGKTLYLYLYSVKVTPITNLPKNLYLAFPYYHRELHDIVLVVDREPYAKIIMGKQKKKKTKEKEVSVIG